MIQGLEPPIRALVLDMDGVLWRGSQPIGDLPALFAKIQQLGLRFILATNNATLSLHQYQVKLSEYGVNIGLDQIINSAQALAFALSIRHPQGGPVYVIGEEGFLSALQERGFYHSDGPAVYAVVVGLDRGITYQKLRQATLLIRAGVPFLGTNPDRTYPAPDGLIPGAGSLLAALEASTDVVPTIAGKPSRAMFDLALERLGSRPEQTLMVGDRLETDIEGGQQAGMRTALMLSGVTTREEALAWIPQPDIISSDLWTLLQDD